MLIVSSGGENKYVIFRLEDESYGINIDDVRSIEKIQDYTRVPNTKEYVKGVMNLRGEVIPIVDLRKKLGLSEKEVNSSSRVIVVSKNDVKVGLLVDSSSEVIEIDKNDIDNPPSTGNKDFKDYIKGIGKVNKRLIILIDLEKLLDLSI
jgi:purine-binding chemotaxis protein CheW